MALITLFEIERRDAAGTVTMLYLTDGQGYNHPSAPGFYEGRIQGAAIFTRSAFAAGTTSGAVANGVGVIRAANADGGLDALLSDGFSGGTMTLKLIDDAAAYGTAQTLAVLRMEQPEFGFQAVEFRVRDPLQDLETIKLQANRYAGNNALPAGLEGTGADLAARVKPVGFGLIRNASLPMVNSSRLIFQSNDGAVNDVTAVYDRGVALTRGADYTSQTDMETNTPAAGGWRVWKAGGYVRLGSVPVGLITADILIGAAAADRTAAQILKTMAISRALTTPSASDVTALDTANSAVLGLFADQEISLKEAMEQIGNSVGAWFGFDRLGVLRMRRFEAPSGSPVVRFVRAEVENALTGIDVNIIAIKRRVLDDPGRGVPITRANLTHQRNWTVQTSDLAGAVTADRRVFLAAADRKVTDADAAILNQFKSAGTRDFTSLIDDRSAAQTEVARLLTLHKIRRDRFLVKTAFTLDLATTVDLGSVVEIRLSRFGLDAGKLFTVIGVTVDLENRTIDYDLWG